MIKIDLITGFLGAGKTTLIHAYARWLMGQGQKIGILENDYGAVNVDRMLLQDLEGPQCSLEMIAGGCGPDCHRRRFRTKLIAMGMLIVYMIFGYKEGDLSKGGRLAPQAVTAAEERGEQVEADVVEEKSEEAADETVEESGAREETQ